MAVSKKTESIMAFRLEQGKQPEAKDLWGGAGFDRTLGANDAVAYTDQGLAQMVGNQLDESIDGIAFEDLPNQTEVKVEGTFGGILKYTGLERLLFWAFGFEYAQNATVITPIETEVFVVSGASATAGATYSNNSSVFTVQGTIVSGNALICQKTSGSNAPSASGTLTKTAGTGDSTIAFSARALVYSHLFELDKHEREVSIYRTGEQNDSTYNVLDRKNRLATIGVKRAPNDRRYRNAMCRKFSISSKAGETAKFSFDMVAYKEDRADYSSSTWTFAEGGAGSGNNIMHHQFNVAIGAPGALIDIGVTDFSMECDIPLRVEQDTESGLYTIEPVFEGKNTVSAKCTISRHSSDLYLAYRDSWATLCLKAVATLGNYEMGLYFPQIKVVESTVSDDDVPKIDLSFACSDEPIAGNPFADEIGEHTLVQKGPVFCVLKSLSSINQMRAE